MKKIITDKLKTSLESERKNVNTPFLCNNELLFACLVCDSIRGKINIRLILDVKLAAPSVAVPPAGVRRLAAVGESSGALSRSRSQARHCSRARHRLLRALYPGGQGVMKC